MNGSLKANDYGAIPQRNNDVILTVNKKNDKMGYQLDSKSFDDDLNGAGGDDIVVIPEGNFNNGNKACIINQLNANSYDFNCNGGRPIQLIWVNSGTFELNMDAVEELSQFEGNVAFVSVVGKYRTGKSFLLNKMLGLRDSEFRIDPNTDTCTQGIWIWSKPVYLEKDNLYIFFLDSEGSNSIEKSAQHDAKIFTLTTLMSSFLIYNSIGVIDENTINELSLITKLTKNIQISPTENTEHALSYYTPKFLWLLRDFNLDLVDNRGKPMTTNQYLENALIDQSSTTKVSETNKKIRRGLLEYFKDRYCHTMVKPTDDFGLKRLDKLSENQVNTDFMNQIKKLKSILLSKILPKQLRGVNLSAKMYFAAVSKYLEALNNGSIPDISLAWDFVVENECRDAYDFSISLYEYALKQFFFNTITEAKTIDEVYHILKNIRDKTMEKYNTLTAFIDKNPEVQKMKDKLKEYVDQREDNAIIMNEELAQTNNEELLKTLSEAIKANLNKGLYTDNNIELYCDNFNEMAVKYENGAKGLKTCSTFISFLNSYNKEALVKIIEAIKKNYKVNENKYATEKSKLTAAQRELQEKLAAYEEREKLYEKQLKEAGQEKDKAITKSNQMEREVDMTNVKCNDLKKELARYKDENYKQKFDETKLKCSMTEEQLAEEKRKHQTDLDELQRKLNQKKACCTIF